MERVSVIVDIQPRQLVGTIFGLPVFRTLPVATDPAAELRCSSCCCVITDNDYFINDGFCYSCWIGEEIMRDAYESREEASS